MQAITKTIYDSIAITNDSVAITNNSVVILGITPQKSI